MFTKTESRGQRFQLHSSTSQEESWFLFFLFFWSHNPHVLILSSERVVTTVIQIQAWHHFTLMSSCLEVWRFPAATLETSLFCLSLHLREQGPGQLGGLPEYVTQWEIRPNLWLFPKTPVCPLRSAQNKHHWWNAVVRTGSVICRGQCKMKMWDSLFKKY